MTTDSSDFDRRARDWLEDGPVQLADPVLDATLAAVPHTPQQRRTPIRRLPMQLTMPRLIAAVVAILVVTGGAIGLAVFRTSNAVISQPSPAAPHASTAIVAPSPASSSATPAAASPQVVLPGSLAVSKVTNAAADIVVRAAGGSGTGQVIVMPGQDVQPAWSRDNAMIAWAASDGIRYANADGTGGAPVTDQGAADGNPEWSPDDTLIVFDSRRDGDFELYTQPVHGGATTQLTSNDVDDNDPSWSPIANRIAFVSRRGGARDIWTMDPDGGDPTQLTGDVGEDSEPAWSPDGTRIAFVSDRDGTSFIYVMNADGSDVLRLSTGTKAERHPTWSPDGRFIAFRTLTTSSVIAIVDVATHAQVGMLSQVRGELDDPAWQNP